MRTGVLTGQDWSSAVSGLEFSRVRTGVLRCEDWSSDGSGLEF